MQVFLKFSFDSTFTGHSKHALKWDLSKIKHTSPHTWYVPHNCHFIPHHALKKQSATTPVRIVYDCSCHLSSKHPSLNDCLVVSPPFLIDMCTLLLRFRTHWFALTTDIKKAFLHVQLAEKDDKYAYFLWLLELNNPDSDFIVFQFCVILFGSVSSPFSYVLPWDVISLPKHQILLATYWLISMSIMLSQAAPVKPMPSNTTLKHRIWCERLTSI